MTKKTSMKDRMSQRLEIKQVTPEVHSAAQQAADEKSVQMVLWMPQREREWFNLEAKRTGKKTLARLVREMLAERFGEPPESFHVPLEK